MLGLLRKVALVLAIALGAGSAAQESRSAAIEETIQSQLEAFLADDVASAFEFASPTIRQLFRTPENFGMMVQRGYPMVWRPADVEFLGLQERSGRLVQQVRIRDGAGREHFLEYYMQEGAGRWLINGVTILEAPDVGV